MAQHVPVSTDAPDTDQPGAYKVGTLTYTLGSLVVLFAFLMLGDFAYALIAQQHMTAMMGIGVGKVLDSFLNHDYRTTFLISGAIALAGATLWTILYCKFKILGGLKGYQPPRL